MHLRRHQTPSTGRFPTPAAYARPATRAGRSTRAGRVGAAWVLTGLALALTACSVPSTSSPESAPGAVPADASTPTSPPEANGTPVAGAPETPPSPSPTELDARWYDLMHVQQTASACTSVWTAGSVLPEDYQWCADAEGNPVAGVRVGPCEVVSYGRTMYAIPGRAINSVAGSIDHDQTYLGLLTACKRKPFPTERR